MNILMMTSAAPEVAPFTTDEKRPPLGVGSLISVLKGAGHRVWFVDNYLEPSDVLETDFLTRNDIDFVGIYSNTICYQKTLEMLHKLQALREKKKWKGKIIVGGPHTSVCAETIPDFVDHIVVGEGELSVPEIIEGSEKKRVVKGKAVVDMDSLPLPAWEEFIYRPYMWTDPWIDSYPVYTFNTSRGCPFDCTFCSVQSVWGRTYRCMSAERVISDVEHMIRHYGMRAAYFREDHFTLKKSRVVDFCELLLKKDIKIDWMCETRVDNLGDLEYQKLMARAGCKVFYIGVESGSPRMLKFLKKEETMEQFVKAFSFAGEAGIRTYASFVVGAPTETEDDRRMTEKLISRIKPDYVGKNVFVAIPGSELYEYVRDNALYEYEDPNKVLYLKGHNERVDVYYSGTPYLKVPGTVTKGQILAFRLKQKVRGELMPALAKAVKSVKQWRRIQR
jgi:radical SAM superfamily enzyme YgiQ (UPF0313 family)